MHDLFEIFGPLRTNDVCQFFYPRRGNETGYVVSCLVGHPPPRRCQFFWWPPETRPPITPCHTLCCGGGEGLRTVAASPQSTPTTPKMAPSPFKGSARENLLDASCLLTVEVFFRNPEKGAWRCANLSQIARQICAKLPVFRFVPEEGCAKLSQICREFESQFRTILCKYPFSNAPFSKFLTSC